MTIYHILESGVIENVYISNSIIANAFDDNLKKVYESSNDLEHQAEILISNNPYLLTKNRFEKSAIKLRKLE